MSRRIQHRSRSLLRADQETRGGKVLKAFRQVDQEDASAIGGVLAELARSGDIPPLKIANGLKAFVIDPRILNREFNKGLSAGVQLGRLSVKVENAENISDEGFPVHFGDASILRGKRRTLLLPIESDRLEDEVKGCFEILSNEGVKGFTSAGGRKGHRFQSPTLAVANFDTPLSHDAESDCLGAIDESLQLRFRQPFREINLGQFTVKTYKQN